MKYWHLKVKVRNGEHEHISQSVHKGDTFDANEYPSDFYGGKSTKLEDGVYEFDYGCIIVSVQSCREITEQEYEILKKHI